VGESIQVLNLVALLVAVSAFGVFAVLDYHDQSSLRVVVSTAPGSTSGVAASAGGKDAGSVAPAGERPVAGAPTLGGLARGGRLPAGSGVGASTVRGGDPQVHQPPALPGGPAPACVDGVINIGQIVPITGPLTVQTAANAVAAYFRRVNAEGGIGGCRVNFTYLDDGGVDQQKAAADARELVQQDNVFAVVGNFEPVTSASTEPYFRKYGVPVIGTDGAALQEEGSPVEYSFSFTARGAGIASANMAKRLGKTRLAVIYLDLDSLQVGFAALREQAARNGQEIVYANAENVASATYGTDVVAARNANPDVVINLLDANSSIREINAMSSNAWYPDLIGMTSTSDPIVSRQEAPWLDNPSHHVYSLRPYLPATADSPEVRDWLETEGRYFPGFDPNSFAEGAWLSAKIFTEIARGLGHNLTRQALFAALEGMRGYHTGLSPDITMTQDHCPNRQVLWMRWDRGTQQYQQILPFGPW
jgi:ABC-type branched-subunit amino acid transport system substrate-binding protein